LRVRVDRVLLALGVGLVLYYAATPQGLFQGKASGDGLVNFLYLPSVVLHRTLDMTQAAREAGSWQMPLVDGHMPNPKAAGPALFWLPFYLAGLGVEALLGALHLAGGKPFGAGPIAFFACGLGTLAYGLWGLGLLFRLTARRLGVGAARIGVVGAALATPALWYLVHQPAYPHGLTLALAAWFIERWEAWRGSPNMRRFVALGAIAGLAMLVRMQEGILLALPAIDLGAALVRRQRRAATVVLEGAACLAAALAVFALQLGLWLHDYGSLLPQQLQLGFMRWSEPSLVGTLFSLRGGLFTWSPIFYLALLGLYVGRRALGPLAPALLIVFGLDAYVNACALDWWGSWSFGARRFVDVSVVVAVGLGALWCRLPGSRGRAALVGVLIACVLIELRLVEKMRTGRIPSSATHAAAGWRWLEMAGAPGPAVSLFRWIGWPPAWPASLPFAVLHRVHPTAFEDVYGEYLLERRYKDHSIDHYAVVLEQLLVTAANPAQQRFFVDGFGPLAGRVLPVVAPRARLFLPLFEHESVHLGVEGVLPAGETFVSWNQQRLPIVRDGRGLALDVPRGLADHGVNELELLLPPGASIATIRLQPISPGSTSHP
jgi:hypothetical protein